MKKKLLILLAVLMLIILTACNNASTVKPTEETLTKATETSQTDTFVEETQSTEATEGAESEEETENAADGVTVRENVTVQRTEVPTEAPTSAHTSAPAQATQSNKVWHNAVYKTVEHPAQTKEVWVVDKEAYTIEVPLYEEKATTLCDACGEDITLTIHQHYHEAGFTYHTETQTITVGTEMITVPEEGHYETVVIQEAWTEKVLVKEAGYY